MFINTVRRSLSTRIPPMVHIMMFVSVLVGFFFATGFDMAGESILYGTGVLVQKSVWGLFLLITASIALVGMFTYKDWMIQLGGIGGFMLWAFACMTLAMSGHWYIFLTFSLLHLLFHGYVYLATTIGVIYRR